jgi:prenylcysteine oxidase / farnesylcysteine lyase
MMLTSYNGVRTRGIPEPEFNSISYHGHLHNADGSPKSEEEWVVKIFSTKRVEDEWLKTVVDHVGWVYRKEVRFAPIFGVYMLLIRASVGRISGAAAYNEVPED